MSRYIAKVKVAEINEICERNNVSMMEFAAAMGVTLQTVYNWRNGKTTFPREHVQGIEREKRAAGEWPQQGPTPAERTRKMRMGLVDKMNAAREKCPDWRERMKKSQAATRIRLGKHLLGRYRACQRNWDDVRESELKDGHRIKFKTFYIQSRKRTDTRDGYVYEGRTKLYYFE